MRRLLFQTLYTAICALIAWYAWLSHSNALPQYTNEAMFIPTFLLYVVTLPASLVVQLIYTLLAQVTPLDQLTTGSKLLDWMLHSWGPLTLAGYLQWFVFIPRLIR